MYEAFYGLKEKPFNLLPDPDYLYMSKSHDNAYTHLEYAISENKGFVIITGEIGSGKTTLLNFLLNKINQDINVGLINNTYIHPDQLLKVICQEFELSASDKDKAQLLDDFQNFLLEQFAAKKRVVLFIDEAQNLSPVAMEEVRLLSNLEAEKNHLIQIILVGQPELKLTLQRNDLKQFAQRISVHCHLKGLDNGEVQQYIRHRLKAAGAKKDDLFSEDSVDLIVKYSKGIPRLINILCDTALVYGFADSKTTIDKDIIQNVIDAREAGGVLTEEAPIKNNTDENNIISVSEESTVNYEPWMQSMERRFQVLENMMMGIDQRVAQITNKRDERDIVVLELFKMLKGSIESRLGLIAKYSRVRKQMEAKKEVSAVVPVEKLAFQKNGRKYRKGSIFLWCLVFAVIVLVAFYIRV